MGDSHSIGVEGLCHINSGQDVGMIFDAAWRRVDGGSGGKSGDSSAFFAVTLWMICGFFDEARLAHRLILFSQVLGRARARYRWFVDIAAVVGCSDAAAGARGIARNSAIGGDMAGAQGGFFHKLVLVEEVSASWCGFGRGRRVVVGWWVVG